MRITNVLSRLDEILVEVLKKRTINKIKLTGSHPEDVVQDDGVTINTHQKTAVHRFRMGAG